MDLTSSYFPPAGVPTGGKDYHVGSSELSASEKIKLDKKSNEITNLMFVELGRVIVHLERVIQKHGDVEVDTGRRARITQTLSDTDEKEIAEMVSKIEKIRDRVIPQ